jgi:hypothetical protein
MKDKLQAVPNANGIERKDDKNPSWIKKPEVIGWSMFGIFIISCATILVFVALRYRYHTPETFPPWVSFLSASILSLLLLAVVIAQAYIYHLQRKAMLGQLDAMQDSLTETRNLVAQNERAVTAAEESARTAREAFHIGEAPYFGITKMTFAEFEEGARPRLFITFLNGGKTPAWHFHATPELVLGDSKYPLTDGERFKCKTELAELVSTFFPTGAERTIEYQTKFELTWERLNRINDKKVILFVIVKARYMDIRKVWHPRTFRCVWNPLGGFHDYDAIDLA